MRVYRPRVPNGHDPYLYKEVLMLSIVADAVLDRVIRHCYSFPSVSTVWFRSGPTLTIVTFTPSSFSSSRR